MSTRALLIACALTAVPGTVLAQDLGLLLTDRDENGALRFRGAAVADGEGGFVALNPEGAILPSVNGYATTVQVPFETSVLGVPGSASAPLPGARGALLSDLLIGTNLQNPEVDGGLALGFATPVVNAAGAEVIMVELSPPPGTTPPSGGPTTLGGDATAVGVPGGGSITLNAEAFSQFGGNGATGPLSFFTAAGDPIGSLEELEADELSAVITVPGLNVFGTAVDLSDLGIADGAEVSALEISSVLSSGFGPDLGFVAGVSEGAPAAIVDDTLILSAFGAFTEDFSLTAASPQGGSSLFSSVQAPIFTSLTVDASDPLIKTIEGDFLLDGSVELSEQAQAAADQTTALLAAGIVTDVSRAISASGTEGFEAGFLGLTAEPHTSAPVLLSVETADFQARALQSRFNRAHDMAAAAGTNTFWIEGFGAFQEQDGAASVGTDGFDADFEGFLAGFDRQLTDQLLVGLSAGFSGGTANFDDLQAEVDVRTITAGVYGLYTLGPLRIGAGAGYGFGEADSVRRLNVAGVVADGDYDVDLFYAYGDIGYSIPVRGTPIGDVSLVPHLGVVYARTDRDGFSESGTEGFALEVSGVNTIDTVFLEPQLSVASEFAYAGIEMRIDVSGGYRYDAVGEASTATGSFVSSPFGPALTVEGAEAERGAAMGGAGFEAKLSDRISLFTRYEGLWGDEFTSHDITGGVSVRF